MHSLLCCGIFRVPSQNKKKLYKTFVEIFSHMPVMYRVTLDMAGFALQFRKMKKKVYLTKHVKGNSSGCNFINRIQEHGNIVIYWVWIRLLQTAAFFWQSHHYPSKINQDLSILLLSNPYLRVR